MLGVDSDNDSAFMSQSVFEYCKGHGLVQTRSRAYKNVRADPILTHPADPILTRGWKPTA
jgi:hypothetical protein